MLTRSDKTPGTALCLLCAVLLLTACDNQSEPRLTLKLLSGDTMGTTWSVKITGLPSHIEIAALKTELENELQAVNAGMSTYLEDSEISLLNRHAGDEAFPISERFYTVLNEALRIARISNGAFDVTVGPLVNLWGFGPVKKMDHVPDEAEILAALAHTGSDKILLDSQQHSVKKLDPAVYIDLSAIAKGYAVDRMADILDQYKIQNYMVEIGGELRLRGLNNRGVPWVIAVEKPDPATRSALVLVQPGQAAVATSGDYRNYYEEDGIRYSHTIDPATGKPVTHRLASVTVVGEKCMTADALATALTVLGPEKGSAFAQQHKLAVLFVIKTDDGFESIATDEFKPYIKQTPAG
jgi:thiamine biosynthesis lipoprotein